MSTERNWFHLRGVCLIPPKTNPYMEHAVMTGIARVSRESMFSDLNNINVVTYDYLG